MSVGTDWEPVLLAVKTTMQTVSVSGSNIGKISLEVGAHPGWTTQGYQPPYWELSLLSAVETQAGAGLQAFEDGVIQIEGFLPWFVNRESSALWRRLLTGVKDALRANPVLRDENGDPTLRDAGLPRVTQNNMVWFSDWEKGVRCHHGVIQLLARSYFTYSVS